MASAARDLSSKKPIASDGASDKHGPSNSLRLSHDPEIRTNVGFTSSQYRFACSTIQALKKNKHAAPFATPVDAVALHYTTIIKRPMDLPTIERKLFATVPDQILRADDALSVDRYSTVDEWVADVRLIVQNCYTFNGRDHPVSSLARELEGAFEKLLKRLPSADAEDTVTQSPASTISALHNNTLKATGRDSLGDSPSGNLDVNESGGETPSTNHPPKIPVHLTNSSTIDKFPLISGAIKLGGLDLTDSIHVGEQIAWGGFSTISRGILFTNSTRFEVALKTLIVKGSIGPLDAQRHLWKRFYREALLWRRLQHPNVVPLLGYMVAPDDSPILVSPWYTKGNIINYISLNLDASRRALAFNIISGLDYLHSITVAHGDLKGENVLIDVDGHASLCDFGMSQFIDEASRITGFTTTDANTGGTDRFMAPELLEDQPKSKSLATDVWALGCLITQVLTDIIPYGHITRRQAVITAIVRGDLPVQDGDIGIESSLWDCIKKCWNTTPEDRPKAFELGICLKPFPAAGTDIYERMEKVFQECYWAVVSCTDEMGRGRYELFNELPSKNQHPVYYQVIRHPIAISAIRKRSNGTYYKTVNEYAQEWRRLFDNARMYYQEGSRIFNDANEMQKVFEAIFKRLTTETELPGSATAQEL